jgi:hypothetical protein
MKKKLILLTMILVFVMVIPVSDRYKPCAISEDARSAGNPAVITVIDLNGDGIKTTHHSSGAYFDHDADRLAEQTGWVDPNDGILVLDVNHNGIIENGQEIFGHCISGKAQPDCGGLPLLKKYDQNGDGRIDAKDKVYNDLRVWLDYNGDGHCDPDELITLKKLNITAIWVEYKDIHQKDAYGNLLLRTGRYENADGSSGAVGDCLVRRDHTYRISNKWLNMPRKIDELPDSRGVGLQKSLHRAMKMDESGKLIQLVRMTLAEDDPATRTVLIEQVLFR